ncbi:uncharacterized protein RCC_02366 [Ramularia collo-cygni]|uniref:Ethanolaminephosphotransferase n=1 Tax=Ramularia collo-cygni TaxID=112498 RepID=A0A2D3UNM0_9PEZI|nr:uncharacterized protein RCC_02366 [Ramularia collo-cygni]CZT16531.1 uncharacterized protein RCC_02366 [Ramularia collo-cygni]
MLPDIQQDGHYLTREEMLAMRHREYHYNAWSNTMLDPYMQPFWRWVVTFVPLWVAPSTLSISGLVCNVVATSITAFAAPTLTEPLPGWVCVINAISIFLYQTFDAIDGKQSYRTQNSEVEEYADHAVDSISVSLNAVMLAAALQLGDSPVLLGLNLMVGLSAFFAAHWAAHSTNSLIFGRVDVTEAQWSMIAMQLVSAATGGGGSAIWDKIIFESPTIRVRDLVGLATGTAMLVSFTSNMLVALNVLKTPLETNGVAIPRTPLTLWPLMTFSIICTGTISCFMNGLLTLQPIPTLLIIGLAMGKAGTTMIVQRLARRHGPTMDLISFSPMAFFALSLLTDTHYSTTFPIGAWTLVGILALNICIFHENVTSDMKTARGIDRFILVEEPGQEGPKDTGFYVAGGNLANVQADWKVFATDAARVKATYS